MGRACRRTCEAGRPWSAPPGCRREARRSLTIVDWAAVLSPRRRRTRSRQSTETASGAAQAVAEGRDSPWHARNPGSDLAWIVAPQNCRLRIGGHVPRLTNPFGPACLGVFADCAAVRRSQVPRPPHFAFLYTERFIAMQTKYPIGIL